jgi:hypothetical protein
MIPQYSTRMSELASVEIVRERTTDDVLLSWSPSLYTRGIHSGHPSLYHVPQYQAMKLEGSEPHTTPRSGHLERAVYAPAVDVEVKVELGRVGHSDWGGERKERRTLGSLEVLEVCDGEEAEEKKE